MNIAKKLLGETSITFAWADETSEEVKLDLFNDDIKRILMLHGLKQKLGDTYASAEKNGWSIADCKREMHAVLASLIAGDWNRKGGGAGGIWVQALARATGEDVAKCQEAWDKMTDDAKKATKEHPDMIEAHGELTLERAKAKAKAAGNVEALQL